MLKKSDIPNIIKTGVILFLITGISAFVLAFVNSATEPVILANEAKKQEQAMKKVLPEADSFDNEEIMKYVSNETVADAYCAVKDGEIFGYAVVVEPVGYGGKISMVVGVDRSGTVTGVDITGQSETAGLGANCTKDEFRNQFIGKTVGIEVVKNNSGENEIDAMTSATITSKAVTEGVNAAIDAAMQIEEAIK